MMVSEQCQLIDCVMETDILNLPSACSSHSYPHSLTCSLSYGTQGTKVILNIYDLVPANEYLYPLGIGVHHSGVEILGSEYSFASGAGIFQTSPKDASGARYRESIEIGSFYGGIAELNSVVNGE